MSRTHRATRIPLAAAIAVVLVAAGCTGGDDESSDAERPDPTPESVEVGPEGYGAVITRTSDGVPHIWAEDDAGVFFGQGYASAQDHPCDLADQILKVHSRRAATFGPGVEDANVDSDFGWAVLGVADRAAVDWDQEPEDVRTMIEGFTAGWNERISSLDDGATGDWCGDAEWVRPIEAEELYAYARSVPLLASGARLVEFIASAKSPADQAAAPTTTTTADVESAMGSSAPPPVASNGWAIGSERSAAGGGMLLANPHFPWIGELRFWEVHLRTADGLDVYGAQLLGLPGVGIGFTEGVAWTHTVSAGKRFTAYSMQLDPADATRYLFDGQSVPMTPRELTVEVLGDDGSTSPVTRTYWSTQFGPVIDFPGVGWTTTATTSYRDANFDNCAFLQLYLRMNRAGSLDELVAAQRELQAIPLFNTVATEPAGRTWYADTAVTPYLSEEAIVAYEQRLAIDGLTKLAQQAGAVLLQGDTSRDVWVDDPEAPWPGVLPWSKLPMIERTDYVMNANDSYWVANSTALITGDFSPLQGLPDTARSVRTRENLAVLDATGAGSPSGEDGRFDLDELTDAALLNRAYTATQWRDGVVARCRGAAGPVNGKEVVAEDGTVVAPASPVDLVASGACDVLAAWDGTYDVDDRGAVLWRETVGHVDYAQMWAVPFDVAQPATTPSGLGPAQANGQDVVLTGLATAVNLLTKAGIELDAPLGEVQWDARLPEERLAVPGGLGQEGLTNVVADGRESASTRQEQPEVPEAFGEGTTLTAEGYPISYGTSFLMALEYTDDGPRARSILTYGETGDPDSPAFSAQMKDFAEKRWKDVRFTSSQIDSDREATVQQVSA